MTYSQKTPFVRRHREWWYATGLLAIVFAMFLVSLRLESTTPAWRVVRAFSEAATVGALADWFAVVALFRAPLGLNFLIGRLGFVGHVAVLPRSQKEIARRAGAYVGENVLTPQMISESLAEIPLVEMIRDGVRANKADIAAIITEGLPRGTRTLSRLPTELLIESAAGRLTDQPQVKAQIHHELTSRVQAWLSANPDVIGNKVRDQIAGIPADSFVARAQAMIGRELQFIRINGTIVGGFVGLLLYGIATMAGAH